MTIPGAPDDYRGAFRTDADALAAYAEAAGIERRIPRAVARPDDASSVQRLVEWAGLHRLPLVPRGSGSSMAGGAIGDGVVVDLGALATIEPVDAARRCVRAGAGAIRDGVDAAARAAGLRFTVDPSSGAFCTIGGMVGTNAAGARSLAFGAMRASVLALDCVFADGSRAELRRGAGWRDIPALEGLVAALPRLHALRNEGPFARQGLRKESSGYALDAFLEHDDIVDLIVGSEGTLCLVVAAELALRELPGATSTVLAAFASLDEAILAATQARDAGAVACELLDRTFLDVARSGGHTHGIPDDTEAVLLAETEAPDAAGARGSAARVAALFHAHHALKVATAMEPAAEAELWEIRHAASPTITRLHPHLRSMQFIEDGAVPPDRFARYVRGVRDALATRGIPGVIFGHAGDAHAHVNPLIDVDAPGWRDVVAGLLDDVTTLVADLGGTLAAEHGDGRLRTPLLDRVHHERTLDAFRLVKDA
ncbi:MAG TPA: FAD-binding oxidoreductase, partial [Gemmatimonadaceae bacterium]|nr:FAD-binding oxidoreductase [Gemmatimonadaceae bacterium]